VPIAPKQQPTLDGNDQQAVCAVCAVCGAAIEDHDDIEDSNGWRWLSDGRGGLLPLCPTCPTPPDIAY